MNNVMDRGLDARNFEMTETARRLANMIMLGTVAEADYEAPRVKVQAGDLLTTWLPWLTARAGDDRSWHAPEIGEQVIILSPSGNPAQGVVLMGLYSDARPAPVESEDKAHITFADGAVIEYDRSIHHLKAVLPDGATTELVSTGGVSIIGDVNVAGDITASGDVTDHTRSMQGDRDIYNGHTHGGVQSGGSTTSNPGQQQ